MAKDPVPFSRQWWLNVISKTSKIIRDLAGAINAILDVVLRIVRWFQ